MPAVQNEASAIYAESLHNAGEAVCQPKDDASKLGRQILQTHTQSALTPPNGKLSVTLVFMHACPTVLQGATLSL